MLLPLCRTQALSPEGPSNRLGFTSGRTFTFSKLPRSESLGIVLLRHGLRLVAGSGDCKRSGCGTSRRLLESPGIRYAAHCAPKPSSGATFHSIAWCTIAAGSRPAKSQPTIVANAGMTRRRIKRSATGTFPSAAIPPLSELLRSQPIMPM
jgi:hypothetical protein